MDDVNRQGDNLISFILRELNNVEMDDNQNEEEIKVSSDEFIESLKIEENQNEDITCSICLEDIKKGDKCITLPCKDHPHIFCANNETCPGIISWLKKSNTCPVCRTEFPHKTNGSEQINEEQNESEPQVQENGNIIRVNGNMIIQLINSRFNINNLIEREEERQLEYAIQASLSDN
jgi:hypothetical protein